MFSVSASPDIILCGWLGSKPQLTNSLSLPTFRRVPVKGTRGRSLCWEPKVVKSFPFKPSGESEYSHACFVLCLSLPVHSTSFVLISVHFFLASGVANTGSRVGPQNKTGHPVRCHKRLVQVPVLRAHRIQTGSKTLLLCSMRVNQTSTCDLIDCLASIKSVQRICWKILLSVANKWNVNIEIRLLLIVLIKCCYCWWIVSRTVSKRFTCNLMTRIESLLTNFEHVPRPEVTLCDFDRTLKSED